MFIYTQIVNLLTERWNGCFSESRRILNGAAVEKHFHLLYALQTYDIIVSYFIRNVAIKTLTRYFQLSPYAE